MSRLYFSIPLEDLDAQTGLQDLAYDFTLLLAFGGRPEQAACSRPAIQPGRARTAGSQYADCSDPPRTMPVCVLAIGLIVPPE